MSLATGTGGNSGDEGVTPGSFTGNLVLGYPTATSIKANLFSPDEGGEAYLAYVTSPGAYLKQTAPTPFWLGNRY
jgi:hypothetical protein